MRLLAYLGLAATLFVVGIGILTASSHHRGWVIVLFVLAGVVVVSGILDLFLTKPRLVFGEPYTEMRPILDTPFPGSPAPVGGTIALSAAPWTAAPDDATWASFAYIPVRNRPWLGSRDAVSVSAQVSFYDSTGGLLYTLAARWPHTVQYLHSELTLGPQEITLPRRNSFDDIDVAMKYLDDDQAYAFNDRNRFASPESLRHEPLGKPPTRVQMEVTSPNARTAKAVFELTAGPDGKIVIQRIRS